MRRQGTAPRCAGHCPRGRTQHTPSLSPHGGSPVLRWVREKHFRAGATGGGGQATLRMCGKREQKRHSKRRGSLSPPFLVHPCPLSLLTYCHVELFDEPRRRHSCSPRPTPPRHLRAKARARRRTVPPARMRRGGSRWSWRTRRTVAPVPWRR